MVTKTELQYGPQVKIEVSCHGCARLREVKSKSGLSRHFCDAALVEGQTGSESRRIPYISCTPPWCPYLKPIVADKCLRELRKVIK